MRNFGSITCFLFCLIVRTLAAESPTVYTFHDKDASPDFKRYGSDNQVDYFRLLEVDGDHLIIGAADSVHNISIDTFEKISLYEWKPGLSESNECLMKSIDDPSSCRNYVRVLSRDERNGYLLICGTNSFRPLCRVIDRNNTTVLQFDGIGISPLDPRHNTTFYRDNDFLYSATVADFSGDDALIFRKNISRQDDYGIRTQKQNTMLLNKPQFVGAIQSDKYVYFFFREQSSESLEAGTYSRVARVCKNDMGGPRNYKYEWSSFVKMRLNCSIPNGNNKNFYFDEIISISNVTGSAERRSIVYATFVSEFEFLRYSVVCAFDLNQIDQMFISSDYMSFESESQKWIRKKRNDRERTTKLGQCQEDSRQLGDEEFVAARKYPLLAESAPNIFGRAVGIHRGIDNYNQIVVLENVQIQEGQVDVLYVGTDQGNVIKMVNLAGKNSTWNTTSDIDSDPMHQVAIFQVSKLPIRRLLIAKNKYLIVVTDPTVYRLPLSFCSSHENCEQCIQARDPHCVWHQGECTNVKNVKQKFVYQDMLKKNSKICDEARAVEKPKLKPKVTTPRPLFKLSDEKRNATVVSDCNCNSTDLNIRSKCNCPSLENTSANTLSQAPIVSNEVEQSKKAGSNWSFWIILGILIVLVQSGALVVLYCKYRSKRRKAKKASVSLKMPKPSSSHSVINAYCPTLTDGYNDKTGQSRNGTLPLKNGTMRRGPNGEVSIQLNENTMPTIY
ncbi:Sema domain-containing protein [Aphelenchoides bicaudatus]|nr:Sema domain-containing protein [Aphelenchoides bicaudatus]